MKDKVDSLVQNDERICTLFHLVQEKASSITTSFPLEYIRAFYLYHLLTFINLDYELYRSAEYSYGSILDLDLILVNEYTFPMYRHSHYSTFYNMYSCALNLFTSKDIALNQNLTLDRSLYRVLAIALYRNHIYIIEDAFTTRIINRDFVPNFNMACKIAAEITETALESELQKLKHKIPTKKNSCKNWLKWAEELRQIMITHRNIGYKFELKESQIKLLDSYLVANDYLAKCLISEDNVSKDTRDKILSRLLMVNKSLKMRSTNKKMPTCHDNTIERFREKIISAYISLLHL